MPFITKSGNKQYTVNPGQKFVVDKLKNVKVGDVIDLPVLFAFGKEKNDKTLKAEVVAQVQADKIRVVKYMRKSNYRRQYGFRAKQTLLKVQGSEPNSDVKNSNSLNDSGQAQSSKVSKPKTTGKSEVKKSVVKKVSSSKSSKPKSTSKQSSSAKKQLK